MFLVFLGYNLAMLLSYAKALTSTDIFIIVSLDLLIYVWFVVHNRILVERLLLTKQYLGYATAFIVAWLLDLLIGLKLSPIEGIEFSLISRTFGFVLYTAFAFFVYFTYKYFKEREALLSIALLKREVELQQLKWQLNPHFLFNALNSIYSYQLEENRFANELTLRLSQLMRYLIDSQNKEKTTLIEELEFIDNYIAFEKERLGYRCRIVYTKEITTDNLSIPPLILFPFIENAFKHGTNSVKETEVSISIQLVSGCLHALITNQIFRAASSSTRTGVATAMKRIQLLFPGRHEFDITQESGSYIVRLKLDLT